MAHTIRAIVDSMRATPVTYKETLIANECSTGCKIPPQT